MRGGTGLRSGQHLVDAIKRAGTADRRAIRDALVSTKNFGRIRSMPSMPAGRAKSIVILKIENGGEVPPHQP
jgi:hypothetical protein